MKWRKPSYYDSLEVELLGMGAIAVVVVIAAILAVAFLFSGCVGALKGGTIGGGGPKQTVRPLAFHTCVPNASIDIDGALVAPQSGTTDAQGTWAVPAVSSLVSSLNLHVRKDGVILPYLPVVAIPADASNHSIFVNGCEEAAAATYPQGVAIVLDSAPIQDVPALPGPFAFAHSYQGNFGGIKVPGCGLQNDSLFDPFLLIKWVMDKPCFEKMMQAHMDRGDNRVAVDPRSGYHGIADIDLWHQPDQIRAFLLDIRKHINNRGEHIEPLLFLAADSHISGFLSAPGVPDSAAEAHWFADLRALAAVTQDVVAGTAVCWECRHQRDYMTPGTFERGGKLIAQLWPKAWHGIHLIVGSSSWSSARDPSDIEGDDPNHGNEGTAWVRCVPAGWCSGLLFQFDTGEDYLNPDASPNYTPAPGALGRWWEIVVRLGNDARSLATSGGDRHGWVQTDVLAWEFIYDTYWNDDPRATEAYEIAFCKRALAYGGLGCGSASYRVTP